MCMEWATRVGARLASSPGDLGYSSAFHMNYREHVHLCLHERRMAPKGIFLI